MRVLTWAIRIALFVVLLAFAAKNTDPVTLRFYFDLVWQAPLVAVLLAFFAAGAALGPARHARAPSLRSAGKSRACGATQLRKEKSRPPVAVQPPAAEG